MFILIISIAPNWAPRLRCFMLELSTLGCWSTNNNTLHVLQRTIGPCTSICRHWNPRECSWNTAQLTLSNNNQSINQRNIALIRCLLFCIMILKIRVITKLPNSEQSYKGKVKTRKYINRQNQSTTGKLWKP